MLYQLSYCPQSDGQVTSRSAEAAGRLPPLARLLVQRVVTLVCAVLLQLEALAVVYLRLHRDVVASLALGALERDLHPLVALRHDSSSFSIT